MGVGGKGETSGEGIHRPSSDGPMLRSTRNQSLCRMSAWASSQSVMKGEGRERHVMVVVGYNKRKGTKEEGFVKTIYRDNRTSRSLL